MADYRHKGVSRLNIPPAGLAARGAIAQEPKLRWAYNPHLAPALRFDATGKADALQSLLAALEAVLRNQEPWLEWAGKREPPSGGLRAVATAAACVCNFSCF